MTNYDKLRLHIQNYIKGNGNREITGFLLQDVLLSIVDTLGDDIIKLSGTSCERAHDSELLGGHPASYFAVAADLNEFASVFNDMFYKTEDGQSIGTKYNFFSEKEASANGLNLGNGGAGGGLIKSVLGASDLGRVAHEDNSTTFNAYAIDYIYKRLVNLENNKQDVDLSDYFTKEQTTSAITTALVPYIKTSDADNKYAPLAGFNTLKSDFDKLNKALNDDVSGKINTWNEIVDFLDEYNGSEDLATILSKMTTDINSRVKISDYENLVNTRITPLETKVNGIDARVIGIEKWKPTVDSKLTTITDKVNTNTNNISKILCWFDVDSEGNLFTTYNFYSTKELSANGLNNGSGAGLVSAVLGATSLGATLTNDNSVVFNAYATNEVYKVTQSNASRIGVLESEVGRLETSIGDGKFLPLSGGEMKGDVLLPINTNSDTYGLGFALGNGYYSYLHSKSGVLSLYNASTGKDFTILHSGNVGDYATGGIVGVYRGNNINANEFFNTDWRVRYNCSIGSESTNVPTTSSWQNAILEFGLHANGSTAQFYFSKDKPLYYRSNHLSDWKELAFTDSTVRAANMLANTRGVTYAYASDGANAVFGVKSYDTYIYGNNVYFRYGSSNNKGLILNSSGNVTIGGSDLAGSAYKLFVDGHIGAANAKWLRWTNASGNYLNVIGVDANNIFHVGYELNGSAYKTSIYGNSITMHYGGDRTAGLILNNGGNVGIGTTTDGGNRVVVERSTNTDLSSLAFTRHGNHIGIIPSNWANTRIISTSWEEGLNDYLDIEVPSYTANTALIRMLRNGNVGIGTTDPTHKLDVAGTQRIETTPSASNVALLSINNLGVGHSFRALDISHPNQSTGGSTFPIIFGVSSAKYNKGVLSFYYAGDGRSSNRMSLGLYAADDLLVVRGDGNVGIGTTNPAYKLDVNGEISTTNLIASGYVSFGASVAITDDPLSSIRTSITGNSNNDSRIKPFRWNNGTGLANAFSGYGSSLYWSSRDTHAYINIGYDVSHKEVYVGGGNADKIHWTGKLFHDNNHVIPRTNNSYNFGSSDYKWGDIYSAGNLYLAKSIIRTSAWAVDTDENGNLKFKKASSATSADWSIQDNDGTKRLIVYNNGNATIGGTLGVSGASTFTGKTTHNGGIITASIGNSGNITIAPSASGAKILLNTTNFGLTCTGGALSVGYVGELSGYKFYVRSGNAYIEGNTVVTGSLTIGSHTIESTTEGLKIDGNLFATGEISADALKADTTIINRIADLERRVKALE